MRRRVGIVGAAAEAEEVVEWWKERKLLEREEERRGQHPVAIDGQGLVMGCPRVGIDEPVAGAAYVAVEAEHPLLLLLLLRLHHLLLLRLLLLEGRSMRPRYTERWQSASPTSRRRSRRCTAFS